MGRGGLVSVEVVPSTGRGEREEDVYSHDLDLEPSSNSYSHPSRPIQTSSDFSIASTFIYLLQYFLYAQWLHQK
jgi:hypothetical protein